MKKFLWIVTIINSLLGALIIFMGIAGPNSAPQQSVFVALGMAVPVISACVAWAYSEIRNN